MERRLLQPSTSQSELNLSLHPKQGVAFRTEATELLYGGAAGGGKSHLMRVAAVIWCASIPGLQVYLFRRIREDLIKNHMEGPHGFRALLADWSFSGLVKIVDDEIRFWNGSKIYLCHCKDEKDIYKYQGAEIHVLIIDEITHFKETMYRFLRNRVRMVGIVLPEQYRGLFPRILCGGNPGNIGHLWVKQTWIDQAKPFDLRRMQKKDGGMLRQFIPATLEDNPSMAEDDPDYESRLEGLGSEQLVKAMRWGDWDVVEGAFFDNWNVRRNVVEPFAIPKSWVRIRSGDWGSARPFSIGWWSLVPDDYKIGKLILPRGCAVRYREWYGMKQGYPNVGLKLTAEAVGQGIASREDGERMQDYVLDPAAFAEDGGPSIAERMSTATKHKVMWRKADNRRVAGQGALGGWDLMRHRINGEAENRPMIVCFSTCLDSIRTIPVLQHDKLRIEDLDSDGEDHAADDWRYFCTSRPWLPTPGPKDRKPRDAYAEASEGADDSFMAL